MKLKARYNSLRSLLQEEEGDDAADTFCKAHYGIGYACDDERELAIALTELTFRPLSFPGLEDGDICKLFDILCKIPNTC